MSEKRLHMNSKGEVGTSVFTDESEVTFVLRDDGVLLVSVADEKAVGSYNEWFECTAALSPEQVEQFAAWLEGK